MDSIITYLLSYNQYLINIIGELLLFISQHIGLMSIFWTQKVKLFYAALLANNSH